MGVQNIGGGTVIEYIDYDKIYREKNTSGKIIKTLNGIDVSGGHVIKKNFHLIGFKGLITSKKGIREDFYISYFKISILTFPSFSVI